MDKGNINLIETTKGVRTLQEWLDFQNIHGELRDRLQSADILLLPTGYMNEEHGFASSTEAFLRFARGQGAKIDVCTNDDEFAIVELNSNTIRLGRFHIKSSTVLSILLGIISNFCYDGIKSTASYIKDDDAQEQVVVPINEHEVEFTISTEDSSGNAIDYNYKGPAEEVKNVSEELTKLINETRDK